MADTGLFSRLRRLFSTDVIIRNVGGSQLKVFDVNKIQQSGEIATNTLIDMNTDVETVWNNLGFSMINLFESIPNEISFSSAYPNPFNPVTMLNFSLPNEMLVEVAVYDMMGRVVIELTNKIYNAGYHELHWDATQNSSGIYFIKMTAGKHISTQKLMLVK